ncbi:DUF222 domain-containing protein [Herbiconiux sp. P18]|uniref:HNH endonuclease n=1 Tax=Herbiconiux liangxiaofengii TaxID=3342795 RepID=UPI0035B91C38
MKPHFESAPGEGPVFARASGAGRDAIGERYDAVVQRIVEAERAIARIEAARTRDFVEAIALAEALAATAVVPTPTEREWARRSLAAEIGCASRRSERTVARLLNESEIIVADLPATLTALASGDISYAHAHSMALHALSLPESSRGPFEVEALPLAAENTAARFDDRARRLRERVHPESIESRSRQAHEERGIWLAPERDGMATLHHHLPAVDALAIHDLVDRTARELRGPDEERTHAQRCSDVLTGIILGRPDGEKTVQPTIIVTVPATTLAGCDDAPADLHGYGPIDAATARRIAAAAPTFLRVLTHPSTGELLDVRRTRYRAPAELRLALIAADETCRFPGCGRRASRSELDHTVAWADGGATSASNLAHLCSSHHHLKHAVAWTVRAAPEPGLRSPDSSGGHPPSTAYHPARTLEWRSPRGATYLTSPASLPPP